MDRVCTYFSGQVSESVDEFLEQFQAITVFKGCNKPEEKLVLLPAFLRGSALYFYRSIKNSCTTFEEISNKLKEEFGTCDYAELFYCARQEQRSLNEFFYHLSELAEKANIQKDPVFIVQFLKGLKPFYKNKLSSSHFANKKDLREVIVQMEKVYPQSGGDQMNLARNPAALTPKFMSDGGRGDNMPTPFSSPLASPSQDVRRDTPGSAPTTSQRDTPRTNRYNLRSNSRPGQPNFRPRQQ